MACLNGNSASPATLFANLLPHTSLRFQLTTVDGNVVGITRVIGISQLVQTKPSYGSESHWQLLHKAVGNEVQVKLLHQSLNLTLTDSGSVWRKRMLRIPEKSGDTSKLQWLRVEPSKDKNGFFKFRFAETGSLLCYDVRMTGQLVHFWPQTLQNNGSVPVNFLDSFGIKIEEITLLGVTYDWDRGTKAAPETTVFFAKRVANNTSSAQNESSEVSGTTESWSTWENAFGAVYKADVSLTCGIPWVDSSKLKFGLSMERSLRMSWGKKESTSHSWRNTVNVTVNPGDTFDVSYSMTRQRLQVPFTANWKIDRNGETFDTDGVYDGATWMDSNTTYTKVTT